MWKRGSMCFYFLAITNVGTEMHLSNLFSLFRTTHQLFTCYSDF